MNSAPRWSYVQARVQARHGELLSEGDWRALEATRSFDQFIDHARATSLRRLTERVNSDMSSHTIERVLRGAWRAYVVEIADWCARKWRPAMLWCTVLPDLPTIDALLRGETPHWVRQDASLVAFLENDRTALGPLTVLLPDATRSTTLGERWDAHWRSLWPRSKQRCALVTLAEAVQTHVTQLALAGPQETSAPYRRDLAQRILRIFRRHTATPVAAFCHLALVALDLERLRGGLVRRALFVQAKETA